MGVRPVLLYDSGCRFCRFIARMLVRLDRKERVAFLPIGDPEAVELLSGISEEERFASIHLVEPGGNRFSRGVALARLVSALGLPAPLRLLGRLYEPIARNRNMFGRHVPDGRAPRRYP